MPRLTIASLPMYDLAELADATDAWWQGLAMHMRREGLADVPDTHTRLEAETDPIAHWTSPQLLFSQTCGYPLTHALDGRVRLVGLPAYACPGCGSDGFYCSMIVVPAASNVHSIAGCRNARAAYNTGDSMSGLLALRVAAARADKGRGGAFFSGAVRSGGHRASLAAVASGEVEVAAIDAVTFALLHKVDPDLVARVRVVGRSPSVPGLPYITSRAADDATVDRLRAALRAAFADPRLADVRAELMLADVVFPDPVSYAIILELEREAAAVRWP